MDTWVKLSHIYFKCIVQHLVIVCMVEKVWYT